MKKIILIITLLLAIGITACNSISTETRPVDNTGEGNQVPRATPTNDPSLLDSGEAQVPYPGLLATAVPLPEGYPATTPMPPYDPYLAAEESTINVLYPVGVQCEDGGTYKSNQDAKAELTAAGITVYSITITDMMVCSACGCPTSAHYLAEIDASDLDTALALGWELEQ